MFASLFKIADIRLVRYGLASVGARAVDFGSFAATWLLRSRVVFRSDSRCAAT